MTYAASTSVSVEKTAAEIEKLIMRYKADNFARFSGRNEAMIAFEMEKRRILFRLPLPDRDDARFKRTPGRHVYRSPEKQIEAWEQACRSKWRALFLCIKAKLESVEAKIETFEDAFLAHIQMPDGHTVGEHVRPRIAEAYSGQPMQALLPPPRQEPKE